MDKDELLIVGGVALTVLVMGWYVKKQAGAALDAAAHVAENLNPLNANNYVNQGITGFYQTLAGDTGTASVVADPFMNGKTAPANVPGAPGYDNKKLTTNAGGYVMNPADAALAKVASFKWPWES